MVQSTSPNLENNIKLSIQVSLNGLSFCAINLNKRKIVFFKDLRFPKKLSPIDTLIKIEKVYEQEEFLQEDFKNVEVLLSNDLYSLVPKNLFKEENASDFLKFNTKILNTDLLAKDILEDSKLVNVYIPYTNINNFFFDKYGEFEYRHCVSILAEEFLYLNRHQKDETKVYLNRNALGYDLLIIQKGKLLLANSFECETKEDFIYYLLFTAEQLGLDPETFELILLGNITKESDYYGMAYTYIKNISFLETSFGYFFEVRNMSPPKGYKFFTLLKSLQ